MPNPFLVNPPVVFVERHVRLTASGETVVENPATLVRQQLRLPLAPTGLASGFGRALAISLPTGIGQAIQRTVAAGPVFFVAEIDAAVPGAASATVVREGWMSYPWGLAAWGGRLSLSVAASATTTIRVSDSGYRTLPTDPSGPVPYPPYMTVGFAINRATLIDPTQTAAGAAWGSMSLASLDGSWDGIVTAWNTDAREVRVWWGAKDYDLSRGIFLDPSFGTLVRLFTGLAGPWNLGQNTLDIPLRDMTYWLDRPLQSQRYLGTGALEGPLNLTGVTKPMTRGGTALNPIRNVTPVLVDEVNRIYQYTDNAGQVVNLYQGGATGTGQIQFQADVADLYTGSTSPGFFRTNNAKGLFQLGLPPASGLAITCDVTGQFPTAGVVTTVVAMARALMLDDLFLPSSALDTDNFIAMDAKYPFLAGIYFEAGNSLSAADAVGAVLAGTALRLAPSRTGVLHLYPLAPIDAPPSFSLTENEMITVTPVAMPSNLDPPPYRVRIGYQHNYTVQTTGLSASITEPQRQFVSLADRFAGWSSNAVLLAYRRPNDLPAIPTALLRGSDAQIVANQLGALFGTRQRLFNVEVPVNIGISNDLGDTLSLRAPIGGLRTVAVGRIMAEQFQADQQTIKYDVMIGGAQSVAVAIPIAGVTGSQTVGISGSGPVITGPTAAHVPLSQTFAAFGVSVTDTIWPDGTGTTALNVLCTSGTVAVYLSGAAQLGSGTAAIHVNDTDVNVRAMVESLSYTASGAGSIDSITVEVIDHPTHSALLTIPVALSS